MPTPITLLLQSIVHRTYNAHVGPHYCTLTTHTRMEESDSLEREMWDTTETDCLVDWGVSTPRVSLSISSISGMRTSRVHVGNEVFIVAGIYCNW